MNFFQPPQPVEDWNGTHDATYERERCYQDDVLGGTGVSGSEDCLYLNIHTPDVRLALSTSPEPFNYYKKLYSGKLRDTETRTILHSRRWIYLWIRGRTYLWG